MRKIKGKYKIWKIRNDLKRNRTIKKAQKKRKAGKNYRVKIKNKSYMV